VKRLFKILLLSATIFIVFLALVALFTQTALFKDWLRNKIVVQANKSLSGELAIGRIDGNLVQRLECSDIVLKVRGDTLLYVPRLYVSFKPTRLLRKEIAFQVIEIDRLRFLLRQYRDRSWNISQLVPAPSTPEPAKPSPFRWKIYLQDLLLQNASVSIDARQENAPLPRSVQNINAKLSLSLEQQMLSIQLQNLTLRPEEPFPSLHDVSFQVALKDDVLEMRNIHIKTSASQLTGNAALDLSGQRSAEAHLFAQPFMFGDLKAFVPDVPLQGEVDAEIIAEYRVDSAKVSVDCRKNYQSIRIGGSLRSLTSRPTIDLSGQFLNINLEDWLEGFSLPSRLNGDFALRGYGKRIKTAHFDGQVKVNNFAWNRHQFDRVRVDFSYHQADVKANLYLQSKAGDARINARLDDITTSQKYDLHAAVSHLDLSAILPLDTLQSDLNLTLTARGEGFRADQAISHLSLSLSPSRIAFLQVDSLAAQARLSNSRYWIDTLYVNTPFMDAELKTQGSFNAIENGRVKLTLKELSQLRKLIHADTLQASGYIEAQVAGHFDSLRTSVHYDLLNLQYNDIKTGSAHGDGLFWLKNRKPFGDLESTFRHSIVAGQSVDSLKLIANINDSLIAAEVAFAGAKRLSGQTTFDFRTAPSPTLLIHNLAIGHGDQLWTKEEVPVRFVFRKEGIQIEGLSLSSGSQFISASGTLAFSGDENFQVQMGDVDLAHFFQTTDENLNLTGLVDVSAYLTGTAENPELSAHALLRNAKINAFPIKELKIDARYLEETLNVDFQLQGLEDQALNGNGRVPLLFTMKNPRIEFYKERPIEAKVSTVGMTVSVFQAYSDQIVAKDGLVFMDLALGNTIEQPELIGNFSIQNAAFELPQYGSKFRDLNLALRFGKNNASLDKLVLRGGNGRLEAKGTMEFGSDLLERGLTSYGLAVHLENLQVLSNKDMEMQMSGDAELNAKNDAAKFTGNIMIDRARIFLPALQKDAQREENQARPLLVTQAEDTLTQRKEKGVKDQPEFIKHLQGSITIELPRNTWIRNPDMNVEVAGTVNVIKSDADFEFFGSIRTVRGSYDLYGRRFDIRQGVITLTGGKVPNPKLDIQARHTFRDISNTKRNLDLKIGGNLQEPQLSFSLDGTFIEETDAVSYLVFGRSSRELTRGEKSQISNQEGMLSTAGITNLATGRLADQITDRLRKQLNLDVIEFKGNGNWRAASITVGKYLTNDLFLSYEREFGMKRSREAEPERVSLEYELSKHFSVQATKGDDKTTGFDFIWKNEVE
jgi:translocation and assembly module TamB